MKNITFILFLFSFLTLSQNSNAQKVWSLKECIEYAHKNNLNIKQQEIQVEQSKNNLTQSKYNFAPTLNASLNHNMNWGRSVNLQDLEIIQNKLSQSTSLNLSSAIDIFDGFSRINTIKSNKTLLNISEQQVEKVKNDISISIAQAYLQIILALEIEKSAVESLKSVEDQMNRTKKLVDAGNQPYSTLLEIEAQLATEKLQLVNARNNVISNTLTLTQLLNLPPSENLSVEAPDVEHLFKEFQNENLSTIYQSALSLPQIESAQLQLDNSKIQYKIQKGRTLPTLSFSAGYGTYYNDSQESAFFSQFNDNRNPSIGFSLRIPIFNNLSTTTAIKNARLDIQRAQIEVENSEYALYKEIQQAYNETTAAYQSYSAALENMEAFQESFNYTQERFNLGMLNGTDYITAKSNLFKAQSEYYQNKFQYIFQLKILDFYKGIPITL